MSEREAVAATKDDWNVSPMPEKTASFIIKKKFTDEEIEKLKLGHIPYDMDDRWFSYFENNEMHIFRSWSGLCIYIVQFDFKKGKHKVIVNRDDSQYTCTDVDEDKSQVASLLGYFAFSTGR